LSAACIGGTIFGGCSSGVCRFIGAYKRVAKNAEFVPPYGLGASMYIRPLLLGTGAELGLAPPQEFTFVVLVTPGTFLKSNLTWQLEITILEE
jgi:branched-subunit amino acid aminotransferase/4-amino-4-deoxychorismate lyase